MPSTRSARFQQLQEQGASFLLTIKGNQKTLHRQIRCQFQGKRHIPVEAVVFEEGHGHAITWTFRAKEAPEHTREAWSSTSWLVVVITTETRDFKSLRKNQRGKRVFPSQKLTSC